MKRISWTMVGILALAAAMRLVNLGGRPLWYDEAFAILYASRSLGEILYGTLAQVQGAAADVHPVAYYFTLHGWMLLAGVTPLAARMLSVGYGLGIVAMTYRLTRALFSVWVARWAALVMAAAPFQIAYSQEARMYAMLGFWSIAALAACVRAWQSNSLCAWAAFAICGALALYSHNLGFLTFIALGLFAVARALVSSRYWILVAKTALAGLVMLLLFAPWLALVPGQFGKIQQAYWIPRPDPKTLVQTLIVFNFDFENAIFPSGLIAPALFGALLLLAVFILQLARNNRQHFAWLLATLAFAPVLVLFLISQWRPVYIIRGLLPAATCYLILAAWTLTHMPRMARYGLLAILAALAGAVLVNYYSYQGFPRGPYRVLDMFLRAQFQPGDVIIHSNKLTFFPAHVYDPTLPQVFLGDPPGSGSDTLARPTQEALRLFPTNLETAVAGKSRVWLVIFRQAIAEVQGEHPHIDWLQTHLKLEQTFSFGDMDVLLFMQTSRAGSHARESAACRSA